MPAYSQADEGRPGAMTFDDIQSRLDELLRDAGCVRYTAREALVDAADCWREIRADDLAHGESGEEPFCNFVVAQGVGIFALYGTGVDFYVIRGEESVFRDRFDHLAMIEVDATRAILASDFGRTTPDLNIEPELCRAWLSAD